MKKLISFIVKDFQIEISYKFSLFLQLAGIVLTVAILHYLSQFIDKMSGLNFEKKGFSYFEFVIIGIAFVSFLRTCLEGPSRQFREDQLSGTLEVISAAETGNFFIALAYSSWKLIMGLLYFSLYCFTAYCFKEFPLDFFKGLNAVVFLLLTYIAIYPFVIISLSFILLFKRGNPFTTLLVSFSILLSGVYYPTEILPEYLSRLSKFFPTTYILSGLRKIIGEGASLFSLNEELKYIILFSMVAIPVSIVVFNAAIKRSRTLGSFSHF